MITRGKPGAVDRAAQHDPRLGALGRQIRLRSSPWASRAPSCLSSASRCTSPYSRSRRAISASSTSGRVCSRLSTYPRLLREGVVALFPRARPERRRRGRDVVGLDVAGDRLRAAPRILGSRCRVWRHCAPGRLPGARRTTAAWLVLGGGQRLLRRTAVRGCATRSSVRSCVSHGGWGGPRRLKPGSGCAGRAG
jgi:hypothetical protein